MIRILQSHWMVALVGAISYLLTTFLVWRTPVVSAHDTIADEAGEAGASWNFKNPEVEQLIADLKQEKEALAIRERQLGEMDARLKAEWQEICQTTQAVYRLQQEFDQNVVRVREEETANLKKLAKVYGAMAPEAAASILKELGDEQVVKILAFMKEAEVAAVMESLAKKSGAEARRAAHLSERLRLSIHRQSSEKAK